MPMRFMMLRALAAATMACLVGGTIAFAQQAPRIRGEIETVDGATLSLKTRDGNSMAVKVADDARVSALVKASLADIKTDSFIGVAGMPQSDGSIEAFSIHIFLPAQRGVVPDRHGPWDARPGSTMTNAYVESAVQEKDANTLMVKYKDGEKKILVTPQTVISAVAPGDKSELKAGTPIIIMGSEKAVDGTVLAKTLYIGRNVRPAM
jgi:outer membrane lipoprotein SlyB